MITTHIMISMLLYSSGSLSSCYLFQKEQAHFSGSLFFRRSWFYLSSQILEKILHWIVLQPQADGSISFADGKSLAICPLWCCCGSYF